MCSECWHLSFTYHFYGIVPGVEHELVWPDQGCKLVIPLNNKAIPFISLEKSKTDIVNKVTFKFTCICKTTAATGNDTLTKRRLEAR